LSGWTAWGALSLVVPADSRTGTGFGGLIGLDGPISPSVSVGGVFGGWSAGSDFDQDSRERYLALSARYSWTLGRFRPFLQAGGGIYWLGFQFQSRNRFASSETEMRGGGFAGIGFDHWVSRGTAVEVSARYHLVPESGDVRADFFEGQIGLRFHL